MRYFQRREFLRNFSAALCTASVGGCGGGAGAGAGALPSSSGLSSVASAVTRTPTGPIRFTLKSGVSSTVAPFCLGYAFQKGHVPANAALVSSLPNVQVTPKNRWQDGSLKFAIIAGVATLTADTPLTVSMDIGTPASGKSLSTSQLRATGITTVVNCGGFGSASWGADDWSNPFKSWVAGPEMSSWIYRKAIGADPHLVAWLEVRLFASGAVEVLPWIENGYLNVPAPTNKSAIYTVVIGGTTRFNAQIDLPNHCRTPLVQGTALSYWLGNDPQVVLKHDVSYLKATGLVPAYRASVPDSAPVLAELVTTFSPLQLGNHSLAMGMAGYHGSIGVLPEWDVLYLTSTNDKAYAGLIVNAYGAGRYGIHFRDETTQRPILFSTYPGLVLGLGSAIQDAGTSTFDTSTPNATGTEPATYGSSHHPSFGFTAYLVTGRWYFMEEVQFVATLNYLKNPNEARQNSKGIFESNAGANTTRGAAWAIRTLAQAACITPDDDIPLRSEFIASFEANVDMNHARYVAQPNNPFGWVEPYSSYSEPGNPAYFESTWMQDFYTAAFGYAKALELNISEGSGRKLTEFFSWKAKSIVGRLGGPGLADYLYADAAEYTTAVAPIETANWRTGVGPWYADWGATYKATLKTANPGVASGLRGGGFPEASGYWANLQPAIAYAVQHKVPGADEAYKRMTSAPNWNQLVAELNVLPVWSVAPVLEVK